MVRSPTADVPVPLLLGPSAEAKNQAGQSVGVAKNAEDGGSDHREQLQPLRRACAEREDEAASRTQRTVCALRVARSDDLSSVFPRPSRKSRLASVQRTPGRRLVYARDEPDRTNWTRGRDRFAGSAWGGHRVMEEARCAGTAHSLPAGTRSAAGLSCKAEVPRRCWAASCSVLSRSALVGAEG